MSAAASAEPWIPTPPAGRGRSRGRAAAADVDRLAGLGVGRLRQHAAVPDEPSGPTHCQVGPGPSARRGRGHARGRPECPAVGDGESRCGLWGDGLFAKTCNGWILTHRGVPTSRCARPGAGRRASRRRVRLHGAGRRGSAAGPQRGRRAAGLGPRGRSGRALLGIRRRLRAGRRADRGRPIRGSQRRGPFVLRRGRALAGRRPSAGRRGIPGLDCASRDSRRRSSRQSPSVTRRRSGDGQHPDPKRSPDTGLESGRGRHSSGPGSTGGSPVQSDAVGADGRGRRPAAPLRRGPGSGLPRRRGPLAYRFSVGAVSSATGSRPVRGAWLRDTDGLPTRGPGLVPDGLRSP